MYESIIVDTCTQFHNKWGIQPNLILVDSEIPVQSNNFPISVYHILTSASADAIRSIQLNAENSHIHHVYVVTNNLDVKSHFNNKKILFLEFNKFYGITVNDIIKNFKDNAVNILLYDNVVIEYSNITNARLITNDTVGLISSRVFEKGIPDVFEKYSVYSKLPDTSILEFNGTVILGKPTGSYDYYTHIHGYKNLTIKNLSDHYELINLTKIITSYLLSENVAFSDHNTYISKIFNIQYPIVIAISEDFKVISEDNLKIVYDDIFNELYLSPSELTTYEKSDMKQLPITNQIELYKISMFLKNKFYTDYKTKYETILKNNTILLENLKNTGLEKIQADHSKTRTKLIKELDDLKSKILSDIQKEHDSMRVEAENKHRSLEKELQNSREKETQLYLATKKREIDDQYNRELAERISKIEELVKTREANEFTRINEYIKQYVTTKIAEADTSIETYKTNKLQEVETLITQLYKTKELDVAKKYEQDQINAQKLIDEFKTNETIRVSNEILARYEQKYTEEYLKQIAILHNDMNELRIKCADCIYNEKENALLQINAEIGVIKQNKLEELNQFLSSHRQTKLHETEHDATILKESILSSAKLTIETELSAHKSEMMHKIQSDIIEYEISTKENILQTARLHGEELIKQQEANILEYKNKRIEEVNCEVELAKNEIYDKKHKEALELVDASISRIKKDKLIELDASMQTVKESMNHDVLAEKKVRFDNLYTELQEIRNREMLNLEKVKKTKEDEMYRDHSIHLQNLREERDREYEILKKETAQSMAREIAEIRSRMYDHVKEEIDKTYTSEIEDLEARHQLRIDSMMIEHELKTQETAAKLQSSLDDLIATIEEQKTRTIQRYEDKTKHELINLEMDVIRLHNKKIQEMNELCTVYRNTELAKIQEEITQLKETIKKETIQEIRTAMTKKCEEEIQEIKSTKLAALESQILDKRQKLLTDLDRDIEILKNKKIATVESDMQTYKREKEQEIIRKMLNMSKLL